MQTTQHTTEVPEAISKGIDNLRVILLSPEQAMAAQNAVRWSVKAALPDDKYNVESIVVNVLAGIRDTRLQAWGLLAEKRLLGLVLTQVLKNDWSSEKSLCISNIAAMEHVAPEGWKMVLDGISNYAKAQGCKHIVAETSNPQVVRMCDALGFSLLRVIYSKEV